MSSWSRHYGGVYRPSPYPTLRETVTPATPAQDEAAVKAAIERTQQRLASEKRKTPRSFTVRR